MKTYLALGLLAAGSLLALQSVPSMARPVPAQPASSNPASQPSSIQSSSSQPSSSQPATSGSGANEVNEVNEVSALYPPYTQAPPEPSRHVAAPVPSPSAMQTPPGAYPEGYVHGERAHARRARAVRTMERQSRVSRPAHADQGVLVTIQTLPPPSQPWPPAPSFASLDTNRDGRVTQAEAKAYWPLASDFLYASHGKRSVGRREYRHWIVSQGVPQH